MVIVGLALCRCHHRTCYKPASHRRMAFTDLLPFVRKIVVGDFLYLNTECSTMEWVGNALDDANASLNFDYGRK